MRHAVHPAPVLVIRQGRIGQFGLSDQLVVVNHADDCVVDRVVAVNPFEIGLHDFDTTHVTFANGGGQYRRAHVRDVGR